MIYRPALIALLAFALNGCIKLDGLFLETEKAESIAKDYHGLPLTLSENPPVWIANAEVEREIYIALKSGKAHAPSALEGAGDYIHGAFLKAPQDCPVERCPLAGRDITFLYQHGNSGHLFRYWYRAVALWQMGANVFVYNYRGYGLSSGEASRTHILEDAETAMTYVKGRSDVDSDRIVAYGYSMGGIPTSYLVGKSKHRGDFFAVILESALDSPDSTLNLSTGTEFPSGFFQDDAPFSGPDFIENAPHLPILHMHGGKDSRVDIQQGYQYYAVLKDRSDYTHFIGKTNKSEENWIAEADHRNLPIVSFKGDLHIPDYYDHKKNPSHCCIHPLEYTSPENQSFLEAIGKTDGEAMTTDATRYLQLVSGWILGLLNER